ncbi:hypothetical protein CWO85_02015 [Candidatus Phytoplasma ziziphi]|uniref:Uncharacterized protein n=1 Tax=Ziziphus jujuba witches'-broom phytoplasma TaxID=135727 RepID=A0A660HMS9_ZIZJU|nr:hypothetical protein [Candidatus Phytoplasma ziziphi]AYJ01292.1 hypothetical protein CWO85_02015 [Candidatus Phytoplasma ziziphi]
MKKQIEQKPLSKHLMITIIILFFCFSLGTYVWIHHQTLIETEKQIIEHQQGIKALQKQNVDVTKKIEQQNKQESQILLENQSSAISNFEEDKNQFQPTNPQKGRQRCLNIVLSNQ